MAGLYVHIPFCKNKCHYCDFYSVASKALLTDVVAAIQKEVGLRRGFFESEGGVKALKTVYFGGGTPSILPLRALESIITRIGDTWDLSCVDEFTLEANPEDITAEYADELSRLGVNRLSIGVQSFSDDILHYINRNHSAETAVSAVRNAQRAGIKNITIDLMYGIPGMTTDDLRRSLDMTLSLDVRHISAYHLGIEDGTVFGNRLRRGLIKTVDQQVSSTHYTMVCDRLREAGYEHYEISNFALPGYRAEHNSAYWSGEPYLGLGPSAHSFNGIERSFNHANNRKYLDGMDNNNFFESEVLTDKDRMNEYIMTRLRTYDGISLADLESMSTGLNCDIIKKHLNTKNLVESGGYLRIPENRWLISDIIISDLFIL